MRVSASAATRDSALPIGAPPPVAAPALKGTRPVYFPEFQEYRATHVYDRYALAADQTFDGPAIVEERESTLVIGPGASFRQLATGNIMVTVG